MAIKIMKHAKKILNVLYFLYGIKLNLEILFSFKADFVIKMKSCYRQKKKKKSSGNDVDFEQDFKSNLLDFGVV